MGMTLPTGYQLPPIEDAKRRYVELYGSALVLNTYLKIALLCVSLVAMGMPLLDGPRLDELAQTAARLNQWEFLLVIAAPNVPGSTGELVNPLAMF